MPFGGFEYTLYHQLLTGHLLMLMLTLKTADADAGRALRDQQAACKHINFVPFRGFKYTLKHQLLTGHLLTLMLVLKNMLQEINRQRVM